MINTFNIIYFLYSYFFTMQNLVPNLFRRSRGAPKTFHGTSGFSGAHFWNPCTSVSRHTYTLRWVFFESSHCIHLCWLSAVHWAGLRRTLPQGYRESATLCHCMSCQPSKFRYSYVVDLVHTRITYLAEVQFDWAGIYCCLL